ncbi:NAD-dependent epimerase/dehydratase family protein [Arsenicitalea aurantiaca]|nr:NAD(P)-dependent oxidoreductase [Arsenicitalea aurantiaca]
MPEILITGGAGMIGRKLAAHFDTLGWPVRRLDIRNGGDDSVEIADFADWDGGWVDRFAGVDTVVHLAANPDPEASWSSIERDNIDLTLNVYEAAVRHKVRRLIFASSNWTMAGHRFESGPLSPTGEVSPVNAYGVSKWIGERLGKNYAEKHDLSVVCFRIGYCQHEEPNAPGPHMGWGIWGQQMWLSYRDLLQAYEKAVTAPDSLKFTVLNLMSDNEGMRWALGPTRDAIGYVPQDSATPVETEEMARYRDALAGEEAQRRAIYKRTFGI